MIDDRFTALRLHGMRRKWLALVETRQHLDLSLSDGLELLLQSEDDDRDVRLPGARRKHAEDRGTGQGRPR